MPDLYDDPQEPFFIEDDGPDITLWKMPNHFTVASLEDLFGWRPGETLREALARQRESLEKDGKPGRR